MKRYGNLTGTVADPDNLRLAFWKAGKGKRHSEAVLAYGKLLATNLAQLREQILAAEVDVGNYHFFKIYDPKERQICAAAFGEQVLHHALMNVCHPHFERVQIHDSYACRKGKGTYAALERAKVFSKKYKWYLKLDVRKYFDSISHEVLEAQLTRMFKDWRLLRIFNAIIGSYEAQPGRGVPIGNLSSQYFANHYLAGLDHFVLEKLRVGGYVRYMDDMVLWSDDKMKLKSAKTEIENHVQSKLLCALKPVTFNRSAVGLTFLGYRVFPRYVALSQRSKRRFFQKMDILTKNQASGVWSEAECQRRAMPLIAFTRHADATSLRQQTMKRSIAG
ncbi:MAG: RNA-directed DNA polymerase [Saprospiraceae bacterium]